MIQGVPIFIPIPKSRHTQCKVEVNGQDVTSRVVDSAWIYPVTSDIGTFTITLNNGNNSLTGLFAPEQEVYFYADNSDGTTLQFKGIIDSTKDNIGEKGRTLGISGRHVSYLLNEFMVCHSSTDTATSEILSDIIDKLPTNYGFTKTNLSTSTDSMSVEWNYKPFMDCVYELCNFSGYDFYVDNNLDIHYFESNSIQNSDDAIVEGDNFLGTKELGTNNYPKKTRVIATGKDDNGNLIIYTYISSEEGDIRKEIYVRDDSANTIDKVKNLAEAKYLENSEITPQAEITSFGLETVKPGDNIVILIPRQEIAAWYRINQITHKFGMKQGGWRTVSNIERLTRNITDAVQDANKKASTASVSKNPNKLNFTLNFAFEEDSGTHDSTAITNGKLVLADSEDTTGTWVSDIYTIDNDVSKIELRVDGKDIWASEFFISLNGGNIYKKIGASEFSTLISTLTPGNQLRIKVTLSEAPYRNLNPEVEGIVLLYS